MTLESIELDRYWRTIGWLRQSGVEINRQLVSDGAVADYRQYCLDSEYYEDERRARRKEGGIWAEPRLHKKPSEWRRR